SYRNENILQFSPLLLPLIVLVPLGLRGSVASLRAAEVVAALVASLSVAGLLLQVLPGMSQVNGELIAFALPINVAVAIGLHRVRTRLVPNRAVDRVPSAMRPRTEVGASG